jgi:hypothetical protein
VSGEAPPAQLRLFPLDASPRRPRGRPRVIPTYTAEQRAGFRRTEEIIAQVRPELVPGDRKLCAGCGRIIHRERRNCGRRWCPLVNPVWLRDREAVIRRALQTHGGPFLVTAITQTQKAGWWSCDASGHPGPPLLGRARLQGQTRQSGKTSGEHRGSAEGGLRWRPKVRPASFDLAAKSERARRAAPNGVEA